MVRRFAASSGLSSLHCSRENAKPAAARPRFIVSILVTASILIPSIQCTDVTRSLFDPQTDTALIKLATGIRTTRDGLVLALCEDIPTAEQAFADMVSTCQHDHIVRGNGKGFTHDRPTPTTATEGCTGCAHEVAGFVSGTLALPGSSEQMAINGRIVFGNTYDGDYYVAPYAVELRDPSGQIVLRGQIDDRGQLSVTTSPWSEPKGATLAVTSPCP